MNLLNNVTIIIRSVNERTEPLCREFIEKQGISGNNIFVIHEKPFSKAMKVGYNTGLENDLKWTYCIDADTLFRKGAIEDMLKIAESESEEVFGLSGKLLDKLFARKRYVGNHLFKTEFLNKMIENIADYKNEQIRPETHAKRQLKKSGLRWARKQIVLGLHDFEQNYYDIARKAYVYSHKHFTHLGDLISLWRYYSESDDDFKAALFGASFGLQDFGKVKINNDSFKDLKEKINESFSPKRKDLDSFLINDFQKLKDVMESNGNSFKEIPAVKVRRYRIFKEIFYEKSYSSLFYHLSKKFLKNLKLGK